MPEGNLKSKTKKGLYWKFLDQFFNYGMQFVVGIVMARLLSPSDYGITALPAVFMAVAGVFIEGGFSSALVRKKDLTNKDLSTAFYYSIILGLLCYAILFFTAPFIAEFYNTPVLTPLIRVTALSFIWGPLNTPQDVILQQRLDFKTPARISIINKIVASIVGITTAYLGFGLWALVVAGLTSSFLGFVQTWFAVRWLPTEKWNKESFHYLWGYGNKLILTNLINTLYGNIGPAFIGKFGSTKDLGNYNRAKGYAAIPSSNVTGVLLSVTFPVLSKMQEDNDRLEHIYRKMIKVSSFIVFPMMCLLAALARPLVIIMITAKWEACIILLQILCFSYMLQPVQILNVNLLQVKGRTDLTLRLEIVKKTVGTIVMIVAIMQGVIAFCLADVLMGLFALVLNTYYTGKIINVGYIKQMKDLSPILVLCAVMFGAVLLVNSFITSLWLQLIIGGLVGCAIYIGGAFAFKFDELEDVKYLLKIKK